jgi:hypothetical protein
VPLSAKATYGGMVYSDTELMVVLTNLASGGRRGESCACPGATSRVVIWEPLVWSSSVRQFESWADGGLELAQQRVWRCLVVLGSHNAGDGAAVLGMATQDRSWRRRHASLVQCHSVVPCEHRVGVRTLFEGFAVLFRGVRRASRTRVGGTVSRS